MQELKADSIKCSHCGLIVTKAQAAGTHLNTPRNCWKATSFPEGTPAINKLRHGCAYRPNVEKKG